MGNHSAYHSVPADLDTRDPAFARKYFLWARQVQCEVVELVAGSKETLAQSRALLLEADRLLALR